MAYRPGSSIPVDDIEVIEEGGGGRGGKHGETDSECNCNSERFFSGFPLSPKDQPFQIPIRAGECPPN